MLEGEGPSNIITSSKNEFAEGATLAVDGLASMGFSERFSHQIAALSDEVKAELQPYFLHFFKNPHNSVAAFDAAIRDCCLDGVLTDTERLGLHDNLLKLLEADSFESSDRIAAIKDGLLEESQELNDTLANKAIEAERRGIVVALQRILQDGSTQAAQRSSFLSALNRISDFEHLPDEAIQSVLSLDPNESEFFRKVSEVLDPYRLLSKQISSQVGHILVREICSIVTQFRTNLANALTKEIAGMENEQAITKDEFVAFSEQSLPGEQLVSDIADVAASTAMAYRAEQIAAAVLSRYTAEGDAEVCYVSLPFSITDRSLHADIFFNGKAFDVKASPHAFVREVAERLGYAHDDLYGFEKELRDRGLSLQTSSGEQVSIHRVLNDPLVGTDPAVCAALASLLNRDPFVFAGSGELAVMAKPLPVVLVPAKALDCVPQLERACEVSLDPLANKAGVSLLRDTREWASRFLHSRHDIGLKIFSRRFEAALAEGLHPDASDEVRKNAGKAAVSHVISLGADAFSQKDSMSLKNASGSGYNRNEHRPLVSQEDTRESLSKIYPASLLQLWEDFGVISFDKSGCRIVIAGMHATPSGGDRPIREGIYTLMQQKAGGDLPRNVASLLPDVDLALLGDVFQRVPNELKWQVLGALQKEVDVRPKISFAALSASFNGDSRGDLESRFGSSTVNLLERAGIVTISPNDKIANFFVSRRPD
jgi:hypothetical protein